MSVASQHTQHVRYRPYPNAGEREHRGTKTSSSHVWFTQEQLNAVVVGVMAAAMDLQASS
jgi:hypothetical protein